MLNFWASFCHFVSKKTEKSKEPRKKFQQFSKFLYCDQLSMFWFDIPIQIIVIVCSTVLFCCCPFCSLNSRYTFYGWQFVDRKIHHFLRNLVYNRPKIPSIVQPSKFSEIGICPLYDLFHVPIQYFVVVSIFISLYYLYI